MSMQVAPSLGYSIPAQEHLDATPIAHFGSWQVAEAERKSSQAASLPPPGKREYPDVYVNGEDVTVTVDPLKNAAWIRDDGTSWRYPQSRHRGALKDHAGVVAAVEALRAPRLEERNFEPTVAMINPMLKWSARCIANSTRGRSVGAKDGKLPVHSKMIYDGTLRGKLDYVVDRDFWFENTHGDRRRTFDCGGVTDICR